SDILKGCQNYPVKTLTGKYERFQAVLVSNLRAWWSNVTAVLAIPTGVTPVGWR
ncbi:hypothetical protein JOB18_044670, partial [Solea senegalensis]